MRSPRSQTRVLLFGAAAVFVAVRVSGQSDLSKAYDDAKIAARRPAPERASIRNAVKIGGVAVTRFPNAPQDQYAIDFYLLDARNDATEADLRPMIARFQNALTDAWNQGEDCHRADPRWPPVKGVVFLRNFKTVRITQSHAAENVKTGVKNVLYFPFRLIGRGLDVVFSIPVYPMRGSLDTDRPLHEPFKDTERLTLGASDAWGVLSAADEPLACVRDDDKSMAAAAREYFHSDRGCPWR